MTRILRLVKKAGVSGLFSICVLYSEEEELLWKYAVRKEFLVKLCLLWSNLANNRREYL